MTSNEIVSRIGERVADRIIALLDTQTKAQFVERWEHGCMAVCATVELWTVRCPQCGMPHDYEGANR